MRVACSHVGSGRPSPAGTKPTALINRRCRHRTFSAAIRWTPAGPSHTYRRVLRCDRPPVGLVRLREPAVRSLGLSAEDLRRLLAVVPARGLSARDRRQRHRRIDPRAPRIDHAHLRPCRVYRAPDHVRAARRAGHRDPARGRQRAAAHDHRLVSAAAQTDVAGDVDDELACLGRRSACLHADRRNGAVCRRDRMSVRAGCVGHAVPGRAARRAESLCHRGAARPPAHSGRRRRERGRPHRGPGGV